MLSQSRFQIQSSKDKQRYCLFYNYRNWELMSFAHMVALDTLMFASFLYFSIISVILLYWLFCLLPKDKVGKSGGAKSGWSICSRVSYRILGVTSRYTWFNPFQVFKCSQGIFLWLKILLWFSNDFTNLNTLTWYVHRWHILKFDLLLMSIVSLFRQLWQQRGQGNWWDKRVYWDRHLFLEN